MFESYVLKATECLTCQGKAAQNPSALQSPCPQPAWADCPRRPLAVSNTYFFTSPHTQPLTSEVHGERLSPAPPCSQFPGAAATAGRRRVPPAISGASTCYNASRGLGGACCQAARGGRLCLVEGGRCVMNVFYRCGTIPDPPRRLSGALSAVAWQRKDSVAPGAPVTAVRERSGLGGDHPHLGPPGPAAAERRWPVVPVVRDPRRHPRGSAPGNCRPPSPVHVTGKLRAPPPRPPIPTPIQMGYPHLGDRHGQGDEGDYPGAFISCALHM